MNESPEFHSAETIVWSATVNGHFVRLITDGAGSAWRCDCGQAAQPRADNPPACEHIRFGFDVWFGRDTPEDVTVTEVRDTSRRR